MKFTPDLQQIAKEHNRFILMALKLLGEKGTQDAANEMVQEMYIKLYDRLNNKDLKPLTYVSTGYIFRMMRNQLYSDTIKKKVEYNQDNDFWTKTQSIEDVNDLTEWRKDVSAKLQLIPFLEREVLLRHQEQSQRDLQRDTGVSRERLRFYRNRAFDKLKQIYAAETKNK